MAEDTNANWPTLISTDWPAADRARSFCSTADVLALLLVASGLGKPRKKIAVMAAHLFRNPPDQWGSLKQLAKIRHQEKYLGGEKDWKANMALLERGEPEEFGKVQTMKMDTKTGGSYEDCVNAISESPLFAEMLRDETRVAAARGFGATLVAE